MELFPGVRLHGVHHQVGVEMRPVDVGSHQHFAVGAVIALAVLIVTMPLGSWWRWLPLLASMIAVMTAAVLKERRIDPKADMQDILATLAGGAVIWAEFVVIALIAR